MAINSLAVSVNACDMLMVFCTGAADEFKIAMNAWPVPADKCDLAVNTCVVPADKCVLLVDA